MRTIAITVLSVLLAGAATGSSAAEPCTCVANGERFEAGSVVCLKLPSGDRLARCSKVLNNTSWKTIADSCPLTSAGQVKPQAEPLPEGSKQG